MIIKTVTMTDFRVFQGRHKIDLEPRTIEGRKRPIILFGGLNGAGKTTILSAIRLVLYGPRSLGSKTSRRAYHEYLSESIHVPATIKNRPTSSELELEFEHGDKGIASTFNVIRKWCIDDGKVEEKLEIFKDGNFLAELSYEQCQAFLNELVPVGVADLFFFDGEKIADLAEEEGSAALREAINRLMGVDIIHRLRGDLATYLKDQGLKQLPKDQQKEVKELEKEYQSKLRIYETLRDEKALLEDELHQLVAEIGTTERLLEERGGAWATSRNSEKDKMDLLLKERDELSEKIRQTLSGVVPLFLAKQSLNSLIISLEAEQNARRQGILKEALQGRLEALKCNLFAVMDASNKSTISKAVDHSYEGLFEKSDGKILHDLSESEFEKVRFTIEELIPEQEKLLKDEVVSLTAIEEQIELTSRNVDRSPDEGFLTEELGRLREQTKQKAELEHNITLKLDEVKRTLREAIEFLKKLRQFDEEFSRYMENNLSADYAAKSRELLLEFAEKTTVAKVQRLEIEFIRAFQKLARKDDISLSASIDPQSFSVTLKDAHGNIIKKQQLSAGEKQIYAIAMLEALGRTTGRNLPIIIDTPLGRLDSKHRNKLILNYFPVASHQVIILSTDTEVDEDFFNNLQEEISHGYEIRYDGKERGSYLKEGYFWKHPLKEAI